MKNITFLAMAMIFIAIEIFGFAGAEQTLQEARRNESGVWRLLRDSFPVIRGPFKRDPRSGIRDPASGTRRLGYGTRHSDDVLHTSFFLLRMESRVLLRDPFSVARLNKTRDSTAGTRIPDPGRRPSFPPDSNAPSRILTFRFSVPDSAISLTLSVFLV